MLYLVSMDRLDIVRNNILKAIEKSGLSRLKVTEKAGISYQHLTRFLNDSTGGEIGIGILQRLSDVLDVPVSYLLGDTDVDGNYRFTACGVRLPEEWDNLMKVILAGDKEEQEKVHRLLSVLLEIVKK